MRPLERHALYKQATVAPTETSQEGGGEEGKVDLKKEITALQKELKSSNQRTTAVVESSGRAMFERDKKVDLTLPSATSIDSEDLL